MFGRSCWRRPWQAFPLGRRIWPGCRRNRTRGRLAAGTWYSCAGVYARTTASVALGWDEELVRVHRCGVGGVVFGWGQELGRTPRRGVGAPRGTIVPKRALGSWISVPNMFSESLQDRATILVSTERSKSSGNCSFLRWSLCMPKSSFAAVQSGPGGFFTLAHSPSAKITAKPGAPARKRSPRSSRNRMTFPRSNNCRNCAARIASVNSVRSVGSA